MPREFFFFLREVLAMGIYMPSSVKSPNDVNLDHEGAASFFVNPKRCLGYEIKGVRPPLLVTMLVSHAAIPQVEGEHHGGEHGPQG